MPGIASNKGQYQNEAKALSNMAIFLSQQHLLSD